MTKKPKKKAMKKLGAARHKTTGKPKKTEARRFPDASGPEAQLSEARIKPIRERPIVTIENIRGETVIGDLLVAFPWTREVLVKNGLRLEAEDAGDIYMSLEAFSAMKGVGVESLVEEVVVVAREPPQQSVPPLVAAPAT